ncbi:MAG: DEAD/DEAH box helicase [Planctomycetes bacterium]|nr:DEAD/DEAH box helicase [Planctomycetota bacterium]
MESTDTSASVPTPTPVRSGFAELGLVPGLAATLAELGYEEPTPIQREALPLLFAGRDVLGQAATGTGKTAAFALPLLQQCGDDEPEPNKPSALVLVPTRELAMQVAEAIHRYGKGKGTRVLPIYGGQSIGQQLRVLSRGVAVVVATPGRALDHLERGTLVLDKVRFVVLDEADEMLDMGFAEDLEALLSRLPEKRQMALFSATLPARIQAIARTHLRDPQRIVIERETTRAGETPRVRQVAYIVPRVHKPAALGRVLDMESPSSAIVFCRTRVEVDELTEAMNARGYRAEALHGGFAQEHRDRVMKRFRSEKIDLLVATDVAARGLDIEHVSHVVNYDVPSDPDDYVHRIGRTGRMGREGVAISLVEPREQRTLKNIGFATKQRIAIATLPTVADLRARRLELTRAAVREALVAGELDAFRAVASELATEHDALDVAAAAMKLAHQASHAETEAQSEEQDIELTPAPRRDNFGPREHGGPHKSFENSRAPRRGGRSSNFEGVRLFIGAGRFADVRPGDLVGAITHEAGVTGDTIGAIQIAERFSIVEVKAEHADAIIEALRGTTLRGRKVIVRRDRDS